MSTTQTEQIRAWLQGARDWQTGLYLYGKYGKNQALKSIFAASGETAYNRAKLIAELERMLLSEVSGKQIAAIVVDEPKPSKYSKGVKTLFQRRSHLHAQLLRVSSLEERRQLAFEILDLSEAIDSQLQGDMRPVRRQDRQLPEDRAALMKMLYNNRAYISKFKNDPAKAAQVAVRIEENKNIEHGLSGRGRPAMENREAENLT